ncbi:MAG TPA: hypothetical protein PLO44_01505 [Candidatus Paceibacterota bacterium]|nr:hypothetical protein [Candidatus Paceibacterota bacterium]
MKKIIIAVFAFVLLFAGQSVFAANVFNGQTGDCNPAIGIGVYGNIQHGSNNCWTATSVTADPGDTVNVAMYYHNNTNSTLTNVTASITKTYVSPTSYKFVGKMTSTQGGTQTIGTVNLNLSAAQAVAYSSTHLMEGASAVLSDTDTESWTDKDGQQISVGSVPPGWENYGVLLVVFKVANPIIVSSTCSITDFSANPSTIQAGDNSVLSWTTDNCTSASISNIGTVTPIGSGSRTVSPTTTTTYTLTASRSGGTTDTQSVTVTVSNNGNNNNDNIPEADTKVASSIDSDSARLKGFVDMNDYDNGVVFFVYGQDEDQIGDVQDDYSTYNEVDEDGDDLQKERVDTGLDGDETYTFDATSLDEDTDYFYTICVQYENNDGDDELVCGDVKDFTTDENGNNNDDTVCEISEFRSNKTSVSDGSSATLTWDTDGCESVYISNIGNVNASGSRAVYPATTTTYVLSAYDSNGNTDTARVTISMTGAAYHGACGVTSVATGVSKTSATLNGITVSPSSASTYFEYGLTSSLGSRTSARNVSGNSSFSETLYNLIPGTVYYYRLVSNCESGNAFGSTTTLRTVSDTAPAVVTPVVHTTNTVYTQNGSPIMLEITDRFEFVKRGDTINYTIKYKNIGKTTLKNSLIQVIVPDGIEMTNTSHGSYSNVNHILNVPLGDLVKNAKGEIYLDAKINSVIADKLVTTATLVYTNPNGAQENAIAYVINIPKTGVSLGAASLFSGIFSMSLLGWLLLILIVLIILLVVRRYMNNKKQKNNQYYPN